MCDFSLMGVPNRLARHDEELVTYRFQTGTLGPGLPRRPEAGGGPAHVYENEVLALG